MTAKNDLTILDEEGKPVPPTGCPFCGSSDVAHDTLEIDAEYAVQEVSCIECESEWREVYRFQQVETILDNRKEVKSNGESDGA